jgi:hypothetical protein
VGAECVQSSLARDATFNPILHQMFNPMRNPTFNPMRNATFNPTFNPG